MSIASVNPSGAGGYITQLNPNDVLFGRGSGPNDHEGNIRFRILVGENKTAYMATNHRQTKAKIAREIVGSVLEKNGRFLKKVELAEAEELGIPKGIDAWISVDEETIMEKAKQALRQQRDKVKVGWVNSPNGSPVPQGRKTPVVAPIEVDSYAAASQYGAEAGAGVEDIRLSNHMQNVETELSSGYAQATHLHPNPYEPIPIGSNAVIGPNNTASLDWRNYTQAAIMSQTQGLTQQQDNYAAEQQQQPIPQLSVSNGQGMMQMRSPMRPPARRISDATRYQKFTGSDSIRVADLMDSFDKLKTKEFDSSQDNSNETLGTITNGSNDTMETFEPVHFGPARDIPSGTAFSMSSCNFSGLMKGALHDSSPSTESGLLKGMLGDSNLESTFKSDTFSGGGKPSLTSSSGMREPSRRSIYVDDKDFFGKTGSKIDSSVEHTANMSMSLSQVWNGKRPVGNRDDVTEGDDDPDYMSGLGKSSLSILNESMGESQGGSMMTANESIFSDIGD